MEYKNYIDTLQYYISLYKFFKIRGYEEKAQEVLQILKEFVKEEGNYVC